MRLIGLHHIHLRVPDLVASRAFLADFGLVEAGEADGKVFLRGAGPAAYNVVLERGDTAALVALALEVEDREELDTAASIHGATPVAPLAGPGGGVAVTLRDPEGSAVRLVHGVARRNPDPLRDGLVSNFGDDKPRKGASQNTAALGPPQLLRLGHIGMFVRDAKACDAWYRNVLGLLPSDLMYAGAPDNLTAGFYRIDRGDQWVDHHTIALFGLGKSDLHHVSFEVQDCEIQFMAHRWLERHGHDPVWGVGRHPKGSHIFDVWRDPSGYRFETFSDTDLLTAAHEPDVFPIQDAEMDLWSDRHFEAYFA